MVFSPNGERWAYLAVHGGRIYWVVSGVEYGPYGTVSQSAQDSGEPRLDLNEASLRLSPDSRHLALRATREGWHLLVVDGLEREVDMEWFPHSIIVFDSPTGFHLIVRNKSEIHMLEATIDQK